MTSAFEAERPSVQNIANNPSPGAVIGQAEEVETAPANRAGRRRDRFRKREILWKLSKLVRVRQCGRTVVSREGVGVRLSADGVAGFAGLAHCGSVWACPVCNAKVMAERGAELDRSVDAARAMGYSIAMVTLTMQHDAGQSLAELWDGLAYAWGCSVGGKVWKGEREVAGLVGYVRAVEVTWGLNGWHVHVHAVLYFDQSDCSKVLGPVALGMWKRWDAALRRKGFKPTSLQGQDWKPILSAGESALGSYLSKAVDTGQRIGVELTSSQTKHEGSTVTPWVLLNEFIATGESKFLGLWWEFEEASKGRRQMTWSRNLRELLGLGAVREDEEIAAEEVGTVEDTVLFIGPGQWTKILRRSSTWEVLDVLETSGPDGLRVWLRLLGVWYRDPEPPSPRAV